LRADLDDVADLGGERCYVILAELEVAALSEPGERARGSAPEQEDDALTQAMEAFLGLCFQANPEGQEDNHGNGAPRDAQNREGSSQLLCAQVREELAQHHFSSLTGFSATCSPCLRPLCTSTFNASDNPTLIERVSVWPSARRTITVALSPAK